MKKLFSLVLILFVCVCSVFAFGCKKEKKDVKVGLICLHDESSTYDKNFIDSMYRALEELGLPKTSLELVTGIGEDSACYDKACELAATCDIVFADSFVHKQLELRKSQHVEKLIYNRHRLIC